MNRFDALKQSFFEHLKKYYKLHPALATPITFALNVDENKRSFGDISSNAALILAQEQKRKPQELAQEIKESFVDDVVKKIEVAGSGFLNFFLTEEFFALVAQDIFVHRDYFFKEHHKPINYSLEFVSANPTGPLHLGHGRGGIIGDVLGNVLRFLGNNVIKEFYINDTGKQIELLGKSLKVRCQQQLTPDVIMPEDGYQGEYLIDVARLMIEEFGPGVVKQPDDIFARFAKDHLLADIQKTMIEYGIIFDIWFSETTLHGEGAIEKAMNQLKEKDLTYVQDNSLWFKSTLFGDDKDRVLRRSTGEYTYIASDIAYLQNKLKRGFEKIVMVLGQDHHSYAVRLKATLQALGYAVDRLHIILYQLVTIKEEGELLRMSKRAGIMVGLQAIIETVGKDVARFFYLHRKPEAHLEFDIGLALKTTEENPVYYIQYAYVRAGSILKKAKALPELSGISENDLRNLGEHELSVLKKIIAFKELLSAIGTHYQTHLLSYYMIELAREFHSYYNKCQVVDLQSIPTSRMRVALIIILHDTLKLGLQLLGLATPDQM